jgi:hypothetical protein
LTDAFALLDFPSQALAVERLLVGRPEDEKLAWLRVHGRLVPLLRAACNSRQVYLFESAIGLRCGFFIAGDKFVFIGDNTTYAAKP